MLTPRELVVVDADSEERDLIVRLIRRPSLGHMLNTLAESNLFFFCFVCSRFKLSNNINFLKDN